VGLFSGGGFFGSGGKTTTTQNTTQVQESQVGVSDSAGAVTAGQVGGDFTVVTTDQGALATALDISRAATDLGRAGIESGEQVATAGLDVVNNAIGSADQSAARVAQFAYDALDANSSLAKATLDSQSDVAGRALNAVSDAGSKVLDFAAQLFEDATSAQSNLTDQNLQGLTTLAKQTSASADDRVQKVALYAFVAIAAVLVLPRLFKGGAM